MRRPGHGRPVGTVTRPWRFRWRSKLPPKLGSVAFEIPGPGGAAEELERAFLLVGFEETASRAYPYRLIFERLAFAAAVELVAGGASEWWFWTER